eukprot:scaffold1734_cov113-Isochrysis_galbana.AAC.28
MRPSPQYGQRRLPVGGGAAFPFTPATCNALCSILACSPPPWGSGMTPSLARCSMGMGLYISGGQCCAVSLGI